MQLRSSVPPSLWVERASPVPCHRCSWFQVPLVATGLTPPFLFTPCCLWPLTHHHLFNTSTVQPHVQCPYIRNHQKPLGFKLLWDSLHAALVFFKPLWDETSFVYLAIFMPPNEDIPLFKLLQHELSPYPMPSALRVTWLLFSKYTWRCLETPRWQHTEPRVHICWCLLYK